MEETLSRIEKWGGKIKAMGSEFWNLKATNGIRGDICGDLELSELVGNGGQVDLGIGVSGIFSSFWQSWLGLSFAL
jgi:hypothetical protein